MLKESYKNQLSVVKNNYLTKISSTLSITNKLLTENNNRNTQPNDDFGGPIQDVNFQKYLTEKLNILVTEGTVAYIDIKGITEIYCSDSSFKSLEWIEYFIDR